MINESFDGMDTPNKKRKRDIPSRFVSSTPIKLANKENYLFSDSFNNGMEHKSIAEIVAEKNAVKLQKVNEFEVIRKPPKKKKKTLEDFSFVNTGLDLKVGEKSINPFEVVRSDNTEAILLAKGVSNQGLDPVENYEPTNVKAATNPFEVIRETELPKIDGGIDNSALELNPPVHVPLMLPLPFTPSVNLRIDFSNMPDNLTPSGLLATKLVLGKDEDPPVIGTPKRVTAVTARKSLSVISEEAEIDIGEELDNYQLQLENSINEAKMQNRKYVFDLSKVKEEPDNGETEEEAQLGDPPKGDPSVVNNATYTKENSRIIETSTKEATAGVKESDIDDTKLFDDHNEDVQFEEVDSFEEDFGKLGQFQRAYRTDAPAVFKKPEVKTSTDSLPKKLNLGGSIRRSIRKLINHKSEKSNEQSENEKHEGLFQSIRHSLRRKAKPKTAPVNLECSVLESRSVFRETSSDDGGQKKTLERPTLKRRVVKTVKTFTESVEEFDHY